MIIYQSDQALNYPKQQIKTPLAGSAWQQLLQPEENISNLMLLAVKFNNTQTGSDCRHSERSSFSNVASVSRSTSAAATVHSRGVRHAARTRRDRYLPQDDLDACEQPRCQGSTEKFCLSQSVNSFPPFFRAFRTGCEGNK